MDIYTSHSKDEIPLVFVNLVDRMNNIILPKIWNMSAITLVWEYSLFIEIILHFWVNPFRMLICVISRNPKVYVLSWKMMKFSMGIWHLSTHGVKFYFTFMILKLQLVKLLCFTVWITQSSSVNFYRILRLL